MNYRLVKLEQNTPEWHDWRAGGFGGSEVPALLGISPYTTREKVIAAKVTGDQGSESNWAMRRGHQLEPAARAAFEDATGITVRPVCVERTDKPHIRASLDGLDLDGIPAEFKCPGLSTHLEMLMGMAPDHWLAQVQYQLLTLRASAGWLVSYNPGHHKPLAIIRVDADPVAQRTIEEAVDKAWAEVQALRNGTPAEARGELVEIDDKAQAVAVDASQVGEQAAELQVVDQQSYEAGAQFLISIARKRKELQELKRHLSEPIKEAQRRIDDFLAAPIKALEGAEGTLKARITAYRTEQERIEREARQKAIREAEERQRKEREEAEAARKAAQAKMDEATNERERDEAARAIVQAEQAVLEAETVVALVAPVQTAPKVKGVGMRANWSAEVVDLPALMRAALEKPELLAFVQVNQQALNAHARLAKDTFSVPGCRVIKEETATVRTK